MHYFAGTSQLFLSDLKLRDGVVPTTDDIMLTIEYEDPESGQARVEEFPFRLGDIEGRSPNLDKASYVDAFARSVERQGILLTSVEVLRQYDRYNRSETLDEATQQVLGQLLDTLESRVAARTPKSTAPSPQELPTASR